MSDELAATANAAGLTLLGSRPKFWSYIAETWRRLPFAATLALYRLQADAQQDRLGILWILLRPVMQATVYGVVFYYILSSSARPANFVPYLLIGVFVFDFYGSSVSRGSKAITGNTKLVQSLGFPRILLPISTTLEQAVRMIPMSALLIVLLLIWREPISWRWLLLIPILLVMWIFNMGMAFIVARLSVHLRDLQQVIPFINRFLFYTSGVFFSFERVLADRPDLLRLIEMVPTYEFISLARGVLMEGHSISPVVLIGAPVWALAAFVFGVIFFWRAEVRYGLED